MGTDKPYRENVGIIIFNSNGQVLVGERLGYPGNYQFPQGGLDAGEKPVDAARRELYEEIGLRVDEAPAFEIPDWLYYEFPKDVPAKLKKYAGQKQKWFGWRWDGNPQTLDLHVHEPEFAKLRWAELDEIVAQIVPFKRTVYAQLRERVLPLIQAYLNTRTGDSGATEL